MMRTVYFTASIVGKKYYLKNYLLIVELLKKQGFQVIADHILENSEEKIRMTKKEDRLRFHQKLEKWINACYFMVAETSFPSISVGYEISLALLHRKPILLLYSEGEPPSLLAYHQEEKLICEKYNEENLPGIIQDFISYIEGKGDVRFTFFLTSEIAAFLDEVSREKNLPKAVYLRQLIEKEMKK